MEQDTSSDTFQYALNKFREAILSQGQSSSSRSTTFTAFVSYCYSWYGISCLIMAIVLNRTLVIASTNSSRAQQMTASRRRSNVIDIKDWSVVLKLLSQVCFRFGTIMVLAYNLYRLLVAVNVMAILDGREGVFYMILRSLPILNYDLVDDKYLVTKPYLVMIGPSTDIYWPVFLSYCLLAYVETFISSIQGQKPYTEAGLTLFEHSLAFQEATSIGNFFFRDERIVKRPSVELLIICVFLTLNHLNIQIGGLVNNNRTRLIPSSIFGIGLLSYFAKIFVDGKWDMFPLIIVGSILPQLLVVGIILISFIIFIMAIFATGFNLKDLNYASFFINDDNSGAPERSLLKFNEDFYPTLMNLGMLSITLAGKSSYITELSIATIDDETWIERNIWKKFSSNIKGLISLNHLDQRKLIEYVKSGRLRGYGNLIADPGMKLVKGQEEDYNYDEYGLGKLTIMKKRIVYLQMMFINLYELLKGLIYDKLIRRKSMSNEGPVEYDDVGEEVYEQFESRRQKLPSFLRKFIRPRSQPPKETAKIIELDDFTEEELSIKYIELLKDNEISEIDNSIDYDAFEESDYEDSDIESIINSDEFFSPEQLKDLVDDEQGIQILQYHLKTDEIITRSKFNEIQTKKDGKNETTKLMEIILSKRQGYLQELLQGKEPVNNDDEFDSNLTCVVCQINQREIITWPCKCFSICDSCRLTLASKGIEGCVCCRRDVDGVSKVFIP